MKLIGLMPVRNEDYIIGFSLRAALRWVDHMVVLDHASTDKTSDIINDIIKENPGRITVIREPSAVWAEMGHRQRTLDEGRKLGGTHFAIIDADEVLTANLIVEIRPIIEKMKPGDVLELPMIPNWRSVDRYRNDGSVWSRSSISVVFYDNGLFYWKAAKDSYEHHSRIPKNGSGIVTNPFKDKAQGGVMHLQFADWRRLRAKHYWYRMVEHLRWPGRLSPDELNTKYDEALDETELKTSLVRPEWLIGVSDLLQHYAPGGPNWFEPEIMTLWKQHGPEAFRGIDIPNELINEPYRPFRGLPGGVHKTVQAPAPTPATAPAPTPATAPPTSKIQTSGQKFIQKSGTITLPMLWYCEDCGIIASAIPNGNPLELAHKSHAVSSRTCPGHGLKIVPSTAMARPAILGRIPKRIRPLIVSYWTNDDYERSAKALEASIRLLRLPHIFSKVDGIDTWEKAVLYKPRYILQALSDHPDRDIIWIDADASVKIYPKLLMDDFDADVALFHRLPDMGEVYGGTMFFKNNDKVHSLVQEWIAVCEGFPYLLDERSLAHAIKGRKDIVFKTLPAGYCWVDRWMRKYFPAEEVVIEQYAVSRKNHIDPARSIPASMPNPVR